MVEWRLDCENYRHLTVVGLHDTGPRPPRRCGCRERVAGIGSEQWCSRAGLEQLHSRHLSVSIGKLGQFIEAMRYLIRIERERARAHTHTHTHTLSLSLSFFLSPCLSLSFSPPPPPPLSLSIFFKAGFTVFVSQYSAINI